MDPPHRAPRDGNGEERDAETSRTIPAKVPGSDARDADNRMFNAAWRKRPTITPRG